MHRRSFLDPRRLLQPLQDLLQGTDSTPTNQPDAVLLHFARRAMATQFEAIFPFGTAHAHQLANTALNEIDRLEALLTVYRPDSAVSRLNDQAYQRPLPLNPELYYLLAFAQSLWRDTGGAFDITLGALIKTWGFFRRQGRVPTPDELDLARTRSGFHHVDLDPDKLTVRFRQPGLEINLGSIGKGYALDRAATLLRQDGFTGDFLLHGGHSSVLAQGHEPGAAHGWAIGLAHPEQKNRRLGQLHLKNRALATSAATFQHFEHAGQKLGHILDPRTGWPAWSQIPHSKSPPDPTPLPSPQRPVLSVTLTAPTATEADALATALFIVGAEGAQDYCAKHSQIGAVMVLAGRPSRPIILGFAKEEFAPQPQRGESE